MSAVSTAASVPEWVVHTPRIVSADVQRTMVGLRPFRPDGFVVRAEMVGDRTVVHHYGHGGCGVTLSWGTAELVFDVVMGTPHRRVAVLGAGAVGLATAALLLERGIDVTVYAETTRPADVTSGVAGAFWAPFTFAAREHQTPALAVKLAHVARLAHRRFSTMVGERYAIRRLPLFIVADDPPILPWELAVVPELFAGAILGPGEHPFGVRYAHRTDTLMIETATYLPALLDDVQRAGARIVRTTLTSRDELAQLPEPLVVNCTGLGTRALFGDDALVPVRGQLTLLRRQAEIDYMLIAPAEGLYMLPRSDGLLLGTSHSYDNWSRAVDPVEEARLLQAFATFFSSTDQRSRVPA